MKAKEFFWNAVKEFKRKPISEAVPFRNRMQDITVAIFRIFRGIL